MTRTRFNRHTFALVAILGTMWYAGAAQQNGSAYMLAFGIGALVLVSWLHARHQLRHMSLRVGSVPVGRAGDVIALPLTVTAGEGTSPTGLEITSPEAVRALFVERVSAERPTHLSLPIRPREAGVSESLRILIRSHFPLGFFTTERVVNVAWNHPIHPRPQGTLPLPQAQTALETADSSTAARKGAKPGGDDFDGMRLWQQGDPLRHVNWKAFARGRPLMVKQFSGSSSQTITLDWESLPLPPSERASQMARWVEDAEAAGLLYAVTLPHQKIPAGSGAAHRIRVLDGLAKEVHSTGTATRDEMVKKRHSAPSSETSDTVPGRPLALLCGAILMAMLPLMGQVPLASVGCFFMALALRWLRPSKPPLHSLARLILVLSGVAGIFLETGSLQGLEGGIGIMLCVIGGKVLESRTARDFQVLAVLGWFLCLCCLVLQQDLGTMLYTAAAALLVAMALVRFRRGTTGIFTPARTVFTLALQALPLMLVCFLFFPRGTAGLVTSLTRSLRHQTGISTTVSPGSIASVAQSEAPAFRVIIHGQQPDPRDLYWRCLTLSNCNGMMWEITAGSIGGSEPAVGTPIRQTLTVEPHGARWMPALDRPVKIIKGGRDHYINTDDQTLRSEDAVRFARRVEVESISGSSVEPLDEAALRRALQLPADLSPRVRQLADELARGAGDAREIVEAGLRHFASQGFQYSLSPGAYGAAPLEEFLFERRIGFCEHFAASFGTLMRLAGVPTRLVIGYQGGELIQPGGYYLVRQFNAHVWNEVWLEGSGWTRFDPTAVLAPTRLSADFRALLGESFDMGFTIPRDALWGQAVLRVQMFWDNLNYQWFTRVVQFNEDEQFSLFAGWGLMRISNMLAIALGAFLLVLTLLWLWIRRPARHPDPAVRLWQQVCRWLDKRGMPRLPHEPPLAYAARVPQVADFATLYAQHRFGSTPLPMKQLRQAADQLHKSLSSQTT
jgi:protein-glutamine gamma-glutamyltransferase